MDPYFNIIAERRVPLCGSIWLQKNNIYFKFSSDKIDKKKKSDISMQ